MRDKFFLKPGLHAKFFEGQQSLLEHLRPENVKLVAACNSGDGSLLEDEPPPFHLPSLMHIWEMPKWRTLYKLMWSFSETDWYADDVSSLQIEHQDLLVGIASDVDLEPRPRDWKGGPAPKYVYVYQEVRLHSYMTRLTYLRHLNWVIANIGDRGWHLQWAAAEVTGTPSQICLLWRVESEDLVTKTLHWLGSDPDTRDRYAEMMLGIGSFHQELLHPESTEAIDNRLDSTPEKAPSAG
ncbi:MAG: hypothetical protein WDO69_18860 [Pseudomonadota bacterium]